MIRPFRLFLLALLFFPSAFFSAGGAETAARGHVALVTGRAFLPALQRWIVYRQSQGYQIHTLIQTPRETPSSFLSWGNILPDLEEIRAQIRDLNDKYPLSAILIVGDGAPLTGQSPDPNDPLGSALNVIPAPRVEAKVIDRFGYETHIASDNRFADLDDDSFPDVPIGRIPARTPKQVEDAVDKILRYEQISPSGSWQRRVALIAGMAGFSPILDNVITNALRQILSTAIPDEYDWKLVQADWRSPYCPDPALFRYTVLDELNQGPLFWVYMGHGLHQELDQLVTPKGNYKIMELDDLEFVNCEKSLPIMIFCACYTGAYDSTEMSIAEEFVLKPNGPIAVIASSRTAMPYGMAIFGLEFLEEAFQRQSAPTNLTLGEYVLAVKRRMKVYETKAGIANSEDAPSSDGVQSTPNGEVGEIAQTAEVTEPDSRSSLRRTADSLARTFDPTSQRLDDQFEDHRNLFNLFGDPLLRIRFPGQVEISLPEEGYQNESITVASAGMAKIVLSEEWSADEWTATAESARVTVELLNLPTRPKIKVKNRTEYSDSDEARIAYQRTFEEVNDRVLASAETTTDDGTWSVELPLPVERTGTYIVRVLITSDRRTETGAERIKIRTR